MWCKELERWSGSGEVKVFELLVAFLCDLSLLRPTNAQRRAHWAHVAGKPLMPGYR